MLSNSVNCFLSIFASTKACEITGTIFNWCALEASSGTIPPYAYELNFDLLCNLKELFDRPKQLQQCHRMSFNS